MFSNNVNNGNTIKLVEENEIIQKEKDVAETMNEFFTNAVSKLNISENLSILNLDYLKFDDPIDKAIAKFSTHPSIQIIKDKIELNDTFSFLQINVSDVENEIKNI